MNFIYIYTNIVSVYLMTFKFILNINNRVFNYLKKYLYEINKMSCRFLTKWHC